MVVDFTPAYIEDGVGIMTKVPSMERDNFVRIFKPFHHKVWLCVGGMVLTVGILLWFINNISPYSMTKINPSNAKEGELNLSMNMWVVFSSYMEQGRLVSVESI